MDQLLPNLIIAGVHKAGTTSVFTYLSLHPAVCGSDTKEIGYFMPLRYNLPLPPLAQYTAHWTHCKASTRYRLEASPSYLYGSAVVAKAIRELLGDQVRILILLRNPVDRLFSFYERKKQNAYLRPSLPFRQFFEQSIQAVGQVAPWQSEDEQALIQRGVQEGIYINYLPDWFECFDKQLRVLFFEDLRRDAVGFMADLCAWLDLDASCYQPRDFVIENQTVGVRLRWLHRLLLMVNKKFEPFWRKNVGLKRTLRQWYRALNARQQGREQMTDEEREVLETFYQPYNRRLAAYLKSKGIFSLPGWLQEP